MKLLFDHNLPPSLVAHLRDLFPNSEHVFNLGLDRSSDIEIREYARVEGLVIVTKDADFSDLCVLKGFPPKSFGFGVETVPRKILSYCCVNTTRISKLWKRMRLTECSRCSEQITKGGAIDASD